MSTWGDAWDGIEKLLVEWLAGQMQHEIGAEAWYAENFPRVLPHGDADAVIWTLEISGGPVTNNRQSRAEMTCGIWQMNGAIVVRGRGAIAVRRCAAELFGHLPAGPADVPALFRAYAAEYPTLQRGLFPIADGAIENEIGFESRIAIRCAFHNPQSESEE